MNTTTLTKIDVYGPRERKASVSLETIVPRTAIDTLTEQLGKDAGEAARKALRVMKGMNASMIQYTDDKGRRYRIKQEA